MQAGGSNGGAGGGAGQRKDPVTMEEEEGWIKFNLHTFNIHRF